MDNFEWAGLNWVSLTLFHGFSHDLKSLHPTHVPLTFPEVLGLICSFPLLENPTLRTEDDKRHADVGGWVTPLASPELTGDLHMIGKIPPATRALLNLPGGFHFTKLRCAVTFTIPSYHWIWC